MKISEPLLLDTNVLVYAHNQDALFHLPALRLISSILKGDIKGVLAQQNLWEFYAVITDKRRVMKHLSVNEASDLVESYLKSSFDIVLPTKETTKIALALGKQGKVKGGQIFDAFLVATMLSNNLKTIITLNSKDFTPFSQIQVINLSDFDNSN